MDNQLELMNQTDRVIRIGDEITSEIILITKDELVISLIGYKADGVIPYKELSLTEANIENLKKFNIGDTITAKVIKLQNEDKNVVLSILEYQKKESLVELKQLFDEKKSFTVKISEIKDKGIVGYFKGIRVFIPASHIDTRFTKDKNVYLGKELEVRLLDFSENNLSNNIASRRVILEEEYEVKQNNALDSLNVGDVVKAEVKRFTNFGAFADVNGVDGLIHLSEISWKHIKSAEEVLAKGQIIDVKVIDLDRETKRLALSIKGLTENPWNNICDKYPVGSIVLGKVVRLNDFGAFVELEDGVDGLVHISQISHNIVKSPSDYLTINEDVKVKILNIDTEKKRVSLSIKEIE